MSARTASKQLFASKILGRFTLNVMNELVLPSTGLIIFAIDSNPSEGESTPHALNVEGA